MCVPGWAVGVTWGRWTQKEWQEGWICSCAASVCSLFRRALSVCWSVPSHQGPILHGTGWVPRRETSSQACHSSREGYVWIVGVFEVTYEEKREKKYTKKTNQGLCYPSFPFWKHLPFLVLNLPVHFRSMFKCTTLWTCDLVTKSICVTEEVAQRLARARQRLWGCRAWISPRRAPGQAAGCQGREHSLSHICVLPGAWTFTWDIFSSGGWAAELLSDPGVPGAPGALTSCLGAREDPELSVCANPASLGVPEHPFVGTGESGGRWSCQPSPCPLSFDPECARAHPETTEPTLGAQFELNISGTELLVLCA